MIAGSSLTIASAALGIVFTLKGASSATSASDLEKGLGPASCTQAAAQCDALAKANDDTQSARRVAGISFLAAGAFGVATIGTMLFWRTPGQKLMAI